MSLNSSQRESNPYFGPGKGPKETKINPEHPLAKKHLKDGFGYYYAFDMGSAPQMEVFNQLLIALLNSRLIEYRQFIDGNETHGSIAYLCFRAPLSRSFRESLEIGRRVRKVF